MHYEEIHSIKRTYLEVIPNTKNEVLIFRKFYDKEIYDYRHVHNEVEIIYVHKGMGVRNIGENTTAISEGDVCLINSNIPHHYILKPKNGQKYVECWVLQFSKFFLGKSFYTYNEIKDIGRFLLNNHVGYSFNSSVRDRLIVKFAEIYESQGVDRLTAFLGLLELMSSPRNYTPIELMNPKDEVIYEGERIRSVSNYIERKYLNEISLDEISSEFGLSKPAFCNLFKKHFNLTFSDYINKLRVNKAAQLLIETDIPISQIYYKSGFKNLSYFNRKFKQTYSCTPLQYRKRLEEKTPFKPGIEF